MIINKLYPKNKIQLKTDWHSMKMWFVHVYMDQED